MTEQELENKMKQILEDYTPLIQAKQIEGEVIASESSSPKTRIIVRSPKVIPSSSLS